MQQELHQQYNILSDLLIKEQNIDGFWSGRLSSSALATAVAIVALKIGATLGNEEKIHNGFQWLLDNVNSNGGYGDTPESKSNVSTSLLCYAAINYCRNDEYQGKETLNGIEQYLETQNIKFSSNNVTASILNYYGKDYTFSVPILSMLAICGVMDNTAFNEIPQLPFELTLLPTSWYSFFNLQVVSYAIPALVAVGICVFKKRKRHNLLFKIIRNKSIKPALKKLLSIVPQSGGFLEAIPLTGFVCLCLTASGMEENAIVSQGIGFLKKQQRPDGSWPIDTDLSTWVTTLSIKAVGPLLNQTFSPKSIEQFKKHLLNLQYKEKHPFNGAMPGGWGWTSFSGSVPDVDDTAGAILALLEMYQGGVEETEAIINGCKWLRSLQNNDGGFPTFCKGWGRLPFDSSCADLTGHALAAILNSINTLGEKIPKTLQNTLYQSVVKASKFLEKNQHPNGSWLPLWFGNQLTDNQSNPVYGTAKVTTYISDCLEYNCLKPDLKIILEHMLSSARYFLILQQNNDGSWGAKRNIQGSIEETSLALAALAGKDKHACVQGVDWVKQEFKNNGLRSAPIGLYFAALWYNEKMYPLIYYLEAVRRLLE
jgi:squalene cyclase